ncbi:Kinesin-like protein kif21b [Perkinsus chesapeaki]|uniref:Kinesin-like protein kif21b n=1 Tax=Perkinsus chesapeaki TaxID=330153 RepID=A0A7J6LS76_PERCH|nr:Kinesin-like protein kif21b [Perkinsus chesapeaki]
MSIPPNNDLRVSLIPEHAQCTEFDDHAPDATTKFHEIEPDMAYHGGGGGYSSPIRTHRSNSDVNDVNPFTSRSLLRATPGLLPLSTAEPLYDSVHTGLGSPYANRSTWGSVGDDYKGNASLSPIRRPRLLSTSMADVSDLMCGMSDEGGIKRRLSTAGTPSERRARKASPAGVSTVHTTFSISSAFVNVGLLSAPYAFAKSGSLSLAVLPIVCLLMFSAAEKVKVCLKRLDSVVRYPLAPLEKDFSLMAYVCFGEIGRSIISTVFVVELTSAMLTYFIMIENSVVATIPTWNNLGVLVASGIFSFFLLFVPMDWLASFQVNNNILEAHIPTSNPTIYYKMVPLSGSHGEQSLLEIEDTYSSYRADGKVLNENGHMVPRNVKNFLSLRRSARSPKEESSNHNLPFENVNVPRAGKYNTCADGRMGFMIVFDSSSEESYEEALNIALLMEETFKRKRARIKPVVYLVANKCDLDSESSRYQQIAHTAELFAREKGMRCWRVSARDFRQVGKLFRDMDPTQAFVPIVASQTKSRTLTINPSERQFVQSNRRTHAKLKASVSISVLALLITDTFLSILAFSDAGDDKAYTFDRVYGQNSTQESLYNASIDPLVSEFFAGYNCTIIAYGQTGSGKTYTMGSASYVSQDSGLIPRVIAEICRRVEECDPEETIELTCRQVTARDGYGCLWENNRFIELYNEEIRDLLDPSAGAMEPTSSRTTTCGFPAGKRGISRTVPSSDKIRIIEDPASKNIIVIGCTEEPVESAADLHLCLDRGSVVRRTASTGMNSQSSRSHAIFTIGMVVKTNPDEASGDGGAAACSYRVAKFHFVDLAGSERIKRTMATGNRLKEGIHINSGLLALGNVICALSSAMEESSSATTAASGGGGLGDSAGAGSIQSHDSLGGNSRTVMIACVSPAAADFAETYNTIKYASRARCITNRPVVNTDPTKKLVMELRQQIRDLTEEKLRFMGLGSGGEGMDEMRNEMRKWQQKYTALHAHCVGRGIDLIGDGFEAPEDVDLEGKLSNRGSEQLMGNNKRLQERCSSLESQLAEYREVMAKVWVRNKKLDAEVAKLTGTTGGEDDANELPPEETGLDASTDGGDTSTTESVDDPNDRLIKHLELDESNLSGLIGAVMEDKENEEGDLAGAVEALLQATSSWMDKDAENSKGEDGLKHSIAAQERHLQGLRNEHETHSAMQQAYLDKIHMYEQMVAKANKEKEELAAQINAKKSDKNMTELLERKQRENQRLLDQQHKEMQQLRRELNSIQKAKDRCGQEVARLEKELTTAKGEKVKMQKQKKEHDEAHRKILQDRDRVINQLKRVQAKKTLEAKKTADSNKKAVTTLTIRNETLLKQLNALKEAQKRRVDSRKKSFGPPGKALKRQQNKPAAVRGKTGPATTEKNDIKIWLDDLMEKQIARDGTAEMAEKLSEELDELEKRLDSQRRYIFELESKMDDTEGMKNRRKSRERYHAELLDAQENLDSMSAQWSVMQKRYIELTDPANNSARPGDSLKEILSVVSSNLDVMAKIFWEDLMSARKRIRDLDGRLTELRDQCSRKESQLAEQSSKMALLRNDFSRRVSELTSQRKISELAMISKQLVDASTPLLPRRSGVRSSDVSRDGSPIAVQGRQSTPGRTEVSEIPVINKGTPSVEDELQPLPSSPVSPSMNDMLSFMPLRRRGMRHSLVDDIESQEVLDLQSQTVYQEALLSRTRSEHIKALQDRIEELEDINVSLSRKLMTAEEEKELLQKERGGQSGSVERTASMKATKRARLAQVTRTTESADYKRSQPIRKWSVENENDGDRKNIERPFELTRKGSMADLRMGETLWGADDSTAPWYCTHRERDAHEYFLTSCCMTEGPSLHLWTGSMGNIRVWDLGGRPTQIKSVPISAGGQNIIVRSMCAIDCNLVAAAVSNSVKIIDKRCPSHSCCVATVATGESKDVCQVALVPNGGAKHLAVACSGLRLYDLRTFEELDRGTKRESTASDATTPQYAKLPSGQMDLLAVVASEDSKLFAGGREKTIRMWTDPTRTLSAQVFQPPHFDAVSCLQPIESSYLVSGSRDKFLKLWEVPTSKSVHNDSTLRTMSRQCLASVQAHSDWITALSLVEVPDKALGPRLISASRDGIVKMWSLQCDTGGPSLKRDYASRHSNGPIAGVTSCPEAEGLFVTVSHDRSFRVWKKNNSINSI